MRNLAIAAAALAAAAFGSAAHADTASDYNLFVLHNMTGANSSTQGRVAVGGSASLSSYSVGGSASSSGVNLVVGGALAASNGSTNGKTIVGGARNYSGWSTSGVQPIGTPIPVDFNVEAARLSNLSELLSTYTANGTTSYVTSPSRAIQTTLTGTSAGLNVFNLDGLKASQTNSFKINITPGSTVLINVTGTADMLSGAGFAITGGDASDILWNFSDATSLSFSNIGLQGSLLAPNASYSGSSGEIDGQVIVGNFTGTTAVKNVKYAGNLLGLNAPGIGPTGPVPEPAVWVMMIGGFGMVGAALRRRRRAVFA